ncbi:unnamed protein product [Vicia faba]|uniref:Uncharacterized protein n=1 Tax=Vicia faba TaxID=3906 RepID=A0AAV1AS48_VICFA|nr:unnamed protein product [Vicia faba]
MDVYGLQDHGFEGYPFTWTNGRRNEDNIQGWLDKSLAKESFFNRFSPIRVSHLARYGCDHATTGIQLESDNDSKNRKRPYIFRFEELWCKDPACENLVAQFWNNSTKIGFQKLEAMKELDDTFKDYRSNNVRKEICRIENLLKEDIKWDTDRSKIEAYKALERQKDNLLQMEEIAWRQRSRVMWLNHGDQNTKFFHGKVSQRRKTNTNCKLSDLTG